MKQNKFSIITVVKNDVLNIQLTINSVRKQNYKKYEHIILDGNSSDGTSQLILKNKNKNKKIGYIRKKDKNLYDAINKGILKTKGDYILLIHSGDFFFNDNVLTLINSFLQKNEDFIYGNLIFYKRFSLGRVWKIGQKKLNKFNAFIIPHPTLVIKKKIAMKLKYNISYRISSDTEYLIKLLTKKRLKFNYVNKHFIYMLSGGTSTSFKNLFNKVFEDLKIYLFHYNILGIIIYIFKIFSKLDTYFNINSNSKNFNKFFKQYKKVTK